MWWPCDELVEGGCVDDINGDDDDESASVLVPFAIVIVIVFLLFPSFSPSGRTDGARPRSRFYDGFQVIYDPGVPRVPTNGFTLNREQLREGDQLVLEHNEFDVSARSTNFIRYVPRTNNHMYRAYQNLTFYCRHLEIFSISFQSRILSTTNLFCLYIIES